MRVITEGDIKLVHWWVGEQGTCNACKTVVEYEVTDNPELSHSRPLCEDTAELSCPVCGSQIKVRRSTQSSW